MWRRWPAASAPMSASVGVPAASRARLTKASSSPVAAGGAAGAAGGGVAAAPRMRRQQRVELRLRQRRRGDVAVDLREHVDDHRVVHHAAALLDDLERGGVAEGRPVRPVGGQRVEAVDHRQDAGADRDLVAAQAARIADAVPVLVMGADDRHDRIRKLDRRQDVGADVDVRLHRLELVRCQLAGLVEDVLGNRQLAGVVEQRRRLDRLQRRRVGDAERPRQPHGVGLDAVDVVAGHVVLGFDGGREGRDRRHVQPVDVAQVALRVIGPPQPRPHRQVAHEDAAASPRPARRFRRCARAGSGSRRRTRRRSSSPTSRRSAHARSATAPRPSTARRRRRSGRS